MTNKYIRAGLALSIITATVVLFQNCGQTSLGITEPGSNSELSSESLKVSTNYCSKVLSNSIEFTGTGGGVWSHELIGNKPHMQINYSMENASLNYAKFSKSVKVAEPGKCTWSNFIVNKNPADNLNKLTPLSGGDITNNRLEVFVRACTDPLSRFVALFHSTREIDLSISAPVFHGAVAIGNSGEDCIDSVEAKVSTRNPKFYWVGLIANRQDQSSDATLFTFDNLLNESVRLVQDININEPSSQYLSLYLSSSQFGLTCTSGYPSIRFDTSRVRLSLSPTSEEVTRVSTQVFCGSAQLETSRTILDL